MTALVIFGALLCWLLYRRGRKTKTLPISGAQSIAAAAQTGDYGAGGYSGHEKAVRYAYYGDALAAQPSELESLSLNQEPSELDAGHSSGLGAGNFEYVKDSESSAQQGLTVLTVAVNPVPETPNSRPAELP